MNREASLDEINEGLAILSNGNFSPLKYQVRSDVDVQFETIYQKGTKT